MALRPLPNLIIPRASRWISPVISTWLTFAIRRFASGYRPVARRPAAVRVVAPVAPAAEPAERVEALVARAAELAVRVALEVPEAQEPDSCFIRVELPRMLSEVSMWPTRPITALRRSHQMGA